MQITNWKKGEKAAVWQLRIKNATWRRRRRRRRCIHFIHQPFLVKLFTFVFFFPLVPSLRDRLCKLGPHKQLDQTCAPIAQQIWYCSFPSPVCKLGPSFKVNLEILTLNMQIRCLAQG